MAKELLYKQNIKIEKFHNVLSPKGMKSVLKRTLVLLCINLLFGQKVYSVDYVNQADVKVFVTDYPNQPAPAGFFVCGMRGRFRYDHN